MIIKNWTIFLYFALSIFTVIPFFQSGFFQIHDDVQVARVYEMAKSLSQGAFPVRWVSDLGYGMGYPLFNFYSVLPYYIGGGLNLFGLDALTATKVIFVLAIITSGLSMYFLVKDFLGKTAALVSGIIYLYFPYHAVNIYVRGALAEISAYVFLPLVFLSFYKIYFSKSFQKAYVVLGVLSLAAVTLSHNLSAFMLLIFLGVFVVLSIITGSNRKNLLLSYATILVLAFFLSSFYSLPAALEAKYTNVKSVIGGGSDYRDHFICFSQLWDSPWGFGGSSPGCIDGISFKLGKINIILAVVAAFLAIVSFKSLKEKKMVVFISVGLLVFSIFMTVEYSSFLWRLPLMDFLQFPWRFLNFVGLFLSFLIGFLVWFALEKTSSRFGFMFSALIILLTVILNIKLFNPQKILNRDFAYYTNPYYLNWTASKISDEYMPKGFISPSNFSEIKDMDLVLLNNELFVYQDRRFDTRQTLIEIASNIFSVIGVVGLLLVIIWKSGVYYGKKTS